MLFSPISQKAEEGKTESEIHLLQMLATDSFSDLLPEDTNESRALPGILCSREHLV